MTIKEKRPYMMDVLSFFLALLFYRKINGNQPSLPLIFSQ